MTQVFEQLSKELKDSESLDQNHWLASYRARAWEAFKVDGLPDRTWEDWRYLSLRSLKEIQPTMTLGANAKSKLGNLPPNQSLQKTRAILKTLEEKGLLSQANFENQVVVLCLNGHYLPLTTTNPKSVTEGLSHGGLSLDTLTSMDQDQYGDFEKNFRDLHSDNHSDKPSKKEPFYHLNGAFLTDGIFITVTKTTEPQDHAIHVIHIMGDLGAAEPSAPIPGPEASRSVLFPRLGIRLKTGAKASLTETYLGLESNHPNPSLCIPVTQVLLEPGAKLEHVRIQQDLPQGIHIGSTQKTLLADSQLKSFSLSSHGSLVRHDLNISLMDKNANAQFDGLFLVKGSQLVDHHTTVDHRVPDTQSRQLYHGIVSDHGRGIFNGKVLVRPGAHGTDARQTNKNLILSSDAEIDTKPELQIDADDVKCSHGAAVGQMDPDHLFYLQARGIPEATARKMLLQAFAHDCLERFPTQNKTLANWVNHQVMEYFAS